MFLSRLCIFSKILCIIAAVAENFPAFEPLFSRLFTKNIFAKKFKNVKHQNIKDSFNNTSK
jgi:hypothetical protein